MRFYIKKNDIHIWEFENYIDLSDNGLFTELTKEQENFYLECCEKKYVPCVDEVIHLAKTQPIIPTLEQYKEQKTAYLSSLSLQAMQNKYPTTQLLTIFFGAEATAINEVKEFQTALQEEYQRLKQEILQAESVEEIDLIVKDANFSNL